MNWKRYQLLIIVGSLSLIASVGLLVWMLQQRGQAQELRNEIQMLQQDQSRLTAREPFPSERSFAVQQEKRQQLLQRRDALTAALREGQISPPRITQAQFGDYVRGTVVAPLRELARTSTRGGENGVILTDPSFGLQNFIDGQLPATAEIPGLLLRLELMQHFARILFASGISELGGIERERPADPRVAPRPAAAAPPVFGAPAPQTPAPGIPGAAPERTLRERRDEKFDQVGFTLRFKIYEDKLWDLLNSLAADDNQLVIRRLEVTNANERLHPPFLRRAQAAGGAAGGRPAQAPREMTDIARRLALLEGGAAASPTAAAATVLPGLASRRELLTGGELLDVTMDIVVFRLKPQQGS